MDLGSPWIVIGFSILAAEVFVSLFTLIFIICVILRNFHMKKKLEAKDKIQMALKVTSIIFITVVTYKEFYIILQPDLYKISHARLLFIVGIVYCMCSCSWLIALQCFFYFIKIVHFRWLLISWAKKRISSIVSRHIVMVEVVSICISLLQLLTFNMAQVSSTNSSYISSTFMTAEKTMINNYGSYLLLIVVYSLFLLATVATFITSAFLRCHINKMKDTNTTGELHQYNLVVQKMMRFLFLYCLFYVAMFLYYFSFFALHSVGYWINLIFVFSFTSAVNVLHILENPNLRTAWKEMTSYFTLCREPDTR